MKICYIQSNFNKIQEVYIVMSNLSKGKALAAINKVNNIDTILIK